MNLLRSTKHFRCITALALFFCVSLLYILGTTRQSWPNFHDANRSPPIDTYFFTWNGTCRVPNVDPYHESILKYLEPTPPVLCSRRAPLTYTAADQGRHVVIVDEDVASQYIDSLDRLMCCYSVITQACENKYYEGTCVNFTLKAVLDVTVEYLYVRCWDSKKSKDVYADMHAVVQKKPSAAESNNVAPTSEEKSRLAATATTQPALDGAPRRLNVLLLGIDSMSRLNMMRTMPKTVAHMTSNEWLELRGYNKVGDNTLPNLLAILNGMNLDQIHQKSCYPTKDVYIDKCPYIWNDFHRRGYVTAYAEDEVIWSTFNFNKGGFKKQPTDLYFRPFMLAATTKLKTVKGDSGFVCVGPKTTTDLFLKYSLDLVTTYDKLFALVWLNNFSHNNLNTPAAFDGLFLTFMKDLKASGALNNTLIMFLSDHGARFGKIRETYVGWLEERLPFFFMWLPEWFREAYPDAYENMKTHRDLLTTPFDVHLTLKEVVDQKIGLISHGSKGCPKCRSLFAAPVDDRVCKDAGITTEWCTCEAQKPTSTSSDIVVNATLFAVEHIMFLLNRAGNESATCASLKLKTIFDARIKASHNAKLRKLEFKDYVIVFYTTPGLALFDATVRYNGPGNYEVIGFISRINSYKADSACMTDRELKLYCFCTL